MNSSVLASSARNRLDVSSLFPYPNLKGKCGSQNPFRNCGTEISVERGGPPGGPVPTKRDKKRLALVWIIGRNDCR